MLQRAIIYWFKILGLPQILLIPKIKTLNLVFFFEIHVVSEKFKLLCGNLQRILENDKF